MVLPRVCVSNGAFIRSTGLTDEFIKSVSFFPYFLFLHEVKDDMQLTRFQYTLLGIGLLVVVAYMYTRTQSARCSLGRIDPDREFDRLQYLADRAEAARCEATRARRVVLAKHMNELSTSGDPHQNLLELAAVYKFGEFGIAQPNDDAAVACARCVLFTSTDPVVKSKARAFMFVECVNDNDIDRSAPQLPFDFARAAIRRAQTITQPGGVLGRARVAARDPQPQRVVVESDPQNSHDSGVVASTRDTLRGLEEGDVESVRENVTKFIATCDVDDEEKVKAIVALESIRDEIDSPYIGVSELDALARVWHAVPDKTIIIQQLASAIEHGVPVCHSGKMARLAGCMDVVDPGQHIPVWAVRQEVFSLASKVRDEVLERVSSEDAQLYQTGHHPAVVQSMTDELRRRVGGIEVGTLDQSIVRSIVDDATAAF